MSVHTILTGKLILPGIVMTLVHMWTTCLAMTGVEIGGFFKSKQIPYSKVSRFPYILLEYLIIAGTFTGNFK